MDKEYVINLNNINNLRQFNTNILYKITSNVDAKYENQTVDAKSLMGLISLSSHNITVIINSDDEEELKIFNSICKPFIIKEGD